MKNTNFPIYSFDSFVIRKDLKELPVILELNGPKEREILHKNDFCYLMFVRQGAGTHIIDFIKYELKVGQVHLVFPGSLHSLELEEGAIVEQVLINRGIFRTFVDQLKFIFSLYQKYPVIDMSEDGIEKLTHVFAGIRKEIVSAVPNSEILKANLAIAAEIINNEIFNRLHHSEYYGNPILFEFISLIDIHFREEKSPSFYASKLNITVNYLNSLCVKLLSQTATSVIHNRVVHEAKKLLFMRDFSVKEVSAGLGFSDPSYFSRFFKINTGVAPKRYKEI